MRKSLLFLFVFLLSCGLSMAQNVKMSPRLTDGGPSPQMASSSGVNSNSLGDAINLWALPSTGSTSGNSRIPRNATARYQREEYLITAAEMAASGFPAANTIDGIGFYIYTAGIGTQTGTLTIYMKNTTDATYTLGSTWTTAGFTTVSTNASWTVPITAGTYTIPFVGGTPFTYTGGAVYVAWEFSNPAGTLPTTTSLVAYCNTTQATMCYGYQGTTLGTALTVTAYRPATQFINNTLVDMFQVTNIYAQEKCPTPYGVPTPLSARVANVSASAQTFNVTMTITDQATSAVRYTSTQAVTALAAGTALVVNFPAWTPANLENDNITVSIPVGSGENVTANNIVTIPVNINTNLYGFCYTLNPVTGYGFTYTGAGGIFATKFHMNGTGTVPGANLFIYNYALNVGNTIYAVVLNSAGTIVAQSANLVLAAGDLGVNKNFTFTTPPPFTNEDFYVGLAQPTGGTIQWYPMACMSEAPYRAATFYSFPIAGGTPTIQGTDYKFMIEAQVAPAQLVAHDVGTLSIDMARVVTTGTSSPKATVKNFGANTESFTVTMIIGAGYSSTKNVTALASGASLQVTFDPWTNSIGDFTTSVCTALGSDMDESNDCQSGAVKVLNLDKQVYGYVAFAGTGSDPVGPTTFNLSTPGVLNSIANQSALQFVNGGTWANGLWYGTVYNTVTPYQFISLDPVTGNRTVIGDMGILMSGLSYNTVNNTMYAVSATNLYTINMTTGLATLVGTNTGISMINLAINNAGVAYSVDVTADVLGTVNLNTGLFTPVGPIGFNANYAQDMEFDRVSGELYMTAEDLSSGWLGWVNQATGTVLKIGAFEGGAEITGFAIPYPSASPLAVTGVATPATCHGAANGAITITVTGGTTPYTYLWSNGATTANTTGLVAGTYTVTVSDVTLATVTGSWTVSEPAALSLSGAAINVSCAFNCDGAININVAGGTTPYSYAWSDLETTQNIGSLCPGGYTVTVTDAHQCVITGNWTVGEPSDLSWQGSVANVACFGGNTGSITTVFTAGGTPPYSYYWSNGATTANITGLTAGTYHLTVTDAHGCDVRTFGMVNQPLAIALSANVVAASCPTAGNGIIDLMINEGTPGYTYLWSNSATTEDLANLAPGTYTVTVTDANGCQMTGNWSVGVLDPVCGNLSVTGMVTTTVCYNAHYTITVAGGTSTFIVSAPGGNATFIAGTNILFEPGTHVAYNAYMHGYISQNFCTNPSAPITAAATGKDEPQLNLSNANFTLYPNPTSGNFTLVQKGEKVYGSVKVEVYSMTGEKVMTEQMIGEKSHEFRFSSIPVGLYFVKVVAGDYVETIKLIKTR